MAGVLLFAVFLLPCSFLTRAQDVRSFQAGYVQREYLDNRHCSYTFVVPPGSRAEGCSPSGQTSTEAVTQEEMDGLKNQVDLLSSVVDSLLSRVDSLSGQLSDEKGKNTELTVNLTRALLQLAEGCAQSGQTSLSTEAVTQEEMDGLKIQVDRLSAMVDSLSAKNTELTVNLTRALLQLDNLTSAVYENSKQTNSNGEEFVETQEETDSLKNYTSSLSRQLSEEKAKNAELTVNLTRVLLQLDNLTTAVYEKDNTIKQCSCAMSLQQDCADYYASGHGCGVYKMTSLPANAEAYCDMDTSGGGWTLIQRRQDGSVPFNRTWEEYKHGFGTKCGEYWLGNENIHLLTNQKNYSLRVDLEDFDGNKRYAEYVSFRVADEADQYRLQLSGYTGDAGDDMAYNNGQMFSTIDRDNDTHGGWHCSQWRGHGGWWFNNCTRANLNGRYLKCVGTCPALQGVMWTHWRGYRYSLKSVSMKIRPESQQ